MTDGPFALVPFDATEPAGDGDFVATSAEPWLAIVVPRLRRLSGEYVSISYRASMWDAPARPVFRFLRDEALLAEAIATAPLSATAIWTGRVPDGTTAIHVSPTNQPGRFGFRIETIRRRSWWTLLLAGLRQAPRPARSALLTRLIGWRPEADHNLAWAIGSHRFETFPTWAAVRARPLESEGLDRPRVAWAEVPPIVVAVLAEGAGAAALERTLDSLGRQSLRRWSALVIGGPGATSSLDPGLSHHSSASEAAASLAGRGSWFCVVPAGATLPPEALAIVAERRAREPQAMMVYGDELAGDRPILKPGWSPRLAALPYLGRAVFASASAFAPAEVERVLQGGAWRVPPGITPVALRRVLLACPAQTGVASPRAPVRALPKQNTRAAVIVLTRDQPVLLTRLTASIRSKTAPGTYRLVIVDNGDPQGPASAALTDLVAAPDVTVLARPGPFNFSALCNEAAADAGEGVLLFLNDDMEVRSDGWLERLVALAVEPDVGAVGARLTYPDGRLQHVGVLAGMGGSAGHFGAPAPGDDPGWAGRNTVLHEVSAVTGACLAVAREKFREVGGFDAAHLPVELSDIDLCFKLNARGWRTLIDPAVHLMHEESFSRGGATFRRLDKYGEQRAIFVERWRHVLRDDPVFHPALSLYSWDAALG